MIGETPQPGEKPPNEGNPWSFSDPGTSWWGTETERNATDPPTGRPRSTRRRAAQAATAGAPSGPSGGGPSGGGSTGATGTLPPPAPVERVGEAAEAHAAGARDAAVQLTEPPIVERHHDQADPYRYDPLRPPSGHVARHTAATVAA